MESIDNTLHWYLHIDLDAFFASVEQLDNPELRGKPVIVGGLPEDRRSVVSTASYEARKYGVHSAMPTFQAYKLCPNGIFVHGRMHRYAELSYQIMNIFRDYSPDVDQMSIDEAFIDLTGTEKLFGPPAETAALIKKRVKQETGLTVSIGLASTKYLAKIASGLNKPDGFCQIKHGDEQNFMLNLPLNKVWGLGPKSLELIKSKGLFSTRDIYERDFETLEFLFGNNMAGFLYNVVRGLENNSFKRETKSHSISAETTFPYDLTDIYMIETELLELAHGVFFRLLKEESFSRTAFVKIRYEDFSTCTIQETTERNIITLDTYYEIIKRLFEKKYQNGRGIRLLGVGFENIVKEEKPYQQDLFENKDEKKQAVEKAILKLSKKHPEIKVQKARTLKAILCFFLLSIGGIKLEAEELFDINNVDFSASGLWKSEFQSGFDITFGNGTTPAFSPQLPVFKQEVELSTLLTLNNKWYFQADFADEFATNTFAFGYKSDNLIRHFRLANRGVTMSRGYSSEYFGFGLQGGNNQAPGASLLLKPQNEKWQADFLVRYDMTEVKSATYYGMNKVNDITLSPADFLYGIEFRFPDEAADLLSEIDSVYIEKADGQYQDSRGKKYRRLTNDEFSAISSRNRLFISKDAGGGKNVKGEVPAILLTFIADRCVSEVITASGSYSEATSFLGKIQEELGDGGKYKLQDFSGERQTVIEGKTALIIQDNNVFSPYLCPTIYSTEKYETDISVQSGKSGNTVTKFKAISSEDFYTSLNVDFFNEKQLSTKIINTNIENSVYPFSEDCPEIYLGLKTNSGLSILSRTYTPIKEILIPKKAASGTVQVYKNGILLPGISFNENTGVIQLNTSVSPADKILITWQEESSDFSSGALALGAGYKINLLPGWDADIILTARQSVNQKNNYFYSDSLKNSFAALSAGTQFEKDGLKLSEKTNLTIIDENTSKGLLLYSWKDLWETYEHNKKEALYPEAVEKEKPEKSAIIHFSPSDFSSYKIISIELDCTQMSVLDTSSASATKPFFIIFDEDTGTKETGKEALRLLIKGNQKITDAIQAKKDATHKLQINLENKTIDFDDINLNSEDYELSINKSVIPSRLQIESDNFSEEIYITKLSYEKAKPYGTFRNYIAAEYKKDGTLISTEATLGTGNFTSPDFFINTKTNAEVTISKFKLAGELSSEDNSVTEAGHSIKTDGNLFGIIFAEDTYRKDYNSGELRKQNTLSLNFNKIKLPVQMSFSTNATAASYIEKQNTELSLEYIQPFKEAQLSLGAKAIAAQKINSDSQYSDISYIQGWKDISSLAYSTGKENASARSNQYTAYFGANLPAGKTGYTLKPKLSYELSDNYNINSPGILFSDKEQLKLTIPYIGNKKTFSFEISRTGGGTQTPESGGTYITDSQKLFATQNERSWFYSQIPFYELFDQQIAYKLPQNANYSAKYEGNFRRSLYNSMKDLYIPSAVTLAVDREIKNGSQEVDLYQIKAVITNNSINNFGSNSLNKSFLWFRQEELTTSLSTVLKLPVNDLNNYKLKIQTFSQLLLYITDKSNITEVFNFAIDNTVDWNVRESLAYTRPSQKSLITELIRHFGTIINAEVKNSIFSVSRKDSMTFEIGKLETNFYQKYEYDHTVSVDFMEYYNIYAGLGGKLILNKEKADQLNLSLTLGAKVQF